MEGEILTGSDVIVLPKGSTQTLTSYLNSRCGELACTIPDDPLHHFIRELIFEVASAALKKSLGRCTKRIKSSSPSSKETDRLLPDSMARMLMQENECLAAGLRHKVRLINSLEKHDQAGRALLAGARSDLAGARRENARLREEAGLLREELCRLADRLCRAQEEAATATAMATAKAKAVVVSTEASGDERKGATPRLGEEVRRGSDLGAVVGLFRVTKSLSVEYMKLGSSMEQLERTLLRCLAKTHRLALRPPPPP